MQNEEDPYTHPKINYPNGFQSTQSQGDEIEGPTIRKLIVIKRVTAEEKIISYQKVIDLQNHFQDPVLILEENSEKTKKRDSKKKQNAKNHPLEEALLRHFGKLPFSEFSEVLTSTKINQVIKHLFVTSVYTVENYFGKAGPKSADKKDLNAYINGIFPVTTHDKNSLAKIAKGIEPPEFNVKLLILEASGLESKSSSGHVYCKIWVSSCPKVIKTTNNVDVTAHPVWIAEFTFLVQNMEKDVIHIEMWYFEDGVLKREETKRSSTTKSKLFAKVLRKSSLNRREVEGGDLIGKAEFNVCDVYSEGADEWIPLTASSKDDSEEVFLHIRVNFQLAEPETWSQGLQTHILLLRICIESSLLKIDTERDKTFNWAQLLNRCEFTLIFLHSVLCCLTQSEDIVCLFTVITHLGVKYEAMSLQFLFNLLNDTVEHLKKRPADFVENRLLLMYKNEVQSLHNYCFKFMCSLHSHNVVTNENNLLEFEYALKGIYLCQSIVEVDAAPLMTLKSEAIDWYERKAKKMMETNPKDRAGYIIDVLNYITLYQKAVDSVIRKLFQQESYTHLTYKHLEDNLTEPLKFHITEFSRMYLKSLDSSPGDNSLAEKGIELYSKMKEFVSYASKAVNIPALDLKMGKYREWFGKPVVVSWFERREMKVLKEIENIVLTNDFKSYHNMSSDDAFKRSVSADRTCEIIHKTLRGLWDLVSSPRTKKCDQMFLSGLHNSCVKYTDMQLGLITSTELMENWHHGRACLCVMANNIWFIALFVEKTVSETVGRWPDGLTNTKICLEESCCVVCSKIFSFYSKNVADALAGVLDDKRGADLSLYTNYIENMIWKEVSMDISLDVLEIFLKTVCEYTTEQVLHYMKENEIQPKHFVKGEFYCLLVEILKETKRLVTIQDKPQTNASVWGESYEKLLSDLEERKEMLAERK